MRRPVVKLEEKKQWLMFNQSIKRIGWACKYVADPSLSKADAQLDESQYRERSTTRAWLARQPPADAESRMLDIISNNAASLLRLVEWCGSQEPSLRMMRIGSGQLPLYTHSDWRDWWQRSDIQTLCETSYRKVGEAARRLDVRLSMHPGQFTCLASDRDEVVARSVEEMEYHGDLIRWMGYGVKFQDFKCNVHVSGRRGTAGIRAIYPHLSPEVRNTITLENDEYSTGLDELITLADLVPLVVDNHHHFIHSHGEILRPADDRYKTAVDSWRGVRPVMHYSASREVYTADDDPWQLPDWDAMIKRAPRGKLRAHSDSYTNYALNDLMLEFWQYTDIMAESKLKNLASHGILADWRSRHHIA